VSTLAIRGRVVVEEEIWDRGTVLLERETIRAVVRGRVAADQTLELGDRIVAPGFVDLQVNGAFGIDVATDPERVGELSEGLLSTGTTAYLPTLVTLPPGKYPGLMSSISLDRAFGAEPLGLHLEGPFINPARRGAHPEDGIVLPDPVTLKELLDGGGVRMVTLAPEMPGGMALVKLAVDSGAVVSLGHSEASFEQALEALESGATSVTHLFNAMSPLHHRDPGLCGAALIEGPKRALACGIIADGRHVHPEMVRLAVERLGAGRLYLVTDAMAAAGMTKGEFSLAGGEARVQGGVPRLEDGTIAGSSLTMDEAVRNAISFTGCSLPEAMRMATETPARLIGEGSRKGRLAPGFDADLVVLSPELEVETVWARGRKA
jgi:N-acetylglucosamine-6-phosphate deacetylase